MRRERLVRTLAALAVGLLPSAAAAQVYKPPLRGAPGGRVGGASRGTVQTPVPLPTIDLLAPNGEAGETASPAPTLYYYVSRPVPYPTRFTISAPWQPQPVIETTIPSATAPGIYAIRTAPYHLQLEPGVVYTWSVSAVVDPQAPSRDIVASASLVRAATAPNLAAGATAGTPEQRADFYAQAGLWYDAVAAAAAAADHDRALGNLLHQVGLDLPPALARTAASPIAIR